MSIIIGRLEFEGPFSDPQDIRPESGIYGIICQVGEEYELLDLDETHCLRDCLESNEYTDNTQFYSETCKGRLSAVVHYTHDLSAAERVEIKQELLAELNQPDAEPGLVH
jgi:hypothetical protein